MARNVGLKLLNPGERRLTKAGRGGGRVRGRTGKQNKDVCELKLQQPQTPLRPGIRVESEIVN
jgi:hypothetical protein